MHTHLLDRIRKKATPTVLGQGIVRKLSKKLPDLVDQFVLGRNEYAEGQRRTAELSQEDDSNKAKAKKTEKVSAANSVVISTDAAPPIKPVVLKKSAWANIRKRFHTKRQPDINMTSRSGAAEKDSDKSKDQNKDQHHHEHGECDKKAPASKATGDCHVHKSISLIRVDEEEAVEAFGTEMYELLHFVMSLLWEPDQMNERLIVVATRVFQYGLRLEHLDDLGDAIHSALRMVLEKGCPECGNHEWDDEISGAWAWLWTSVATSLKKTIGSLQNDHQKIIRGCWYD
jgi:hypothetical protein